MKKCSASSLNVLAQSDVTLLYNVNMISTTCISRTHLSTFGSKASVLSERLSMMYGILYLLLLGEFITRQAAFTAANLAAGVFLSRLQRKRTSGVWHGILACRRQALIC